MNSKALKIELPEVNDIDIDQVIKDYTVDIKRQTFYPPWVMAIIEDNEYRYIMHKSSFSAIKGQAKGRKSTLMSMLSAAFCESPNPLLNTFQGKFNDNDMCIYFDTEQASHECDRFVRMIDKLSLLNDNFKMIRLRTFNPHERFEIVQKITEKYKDRLAFTIIDGILDLVAEMNSEKQASEITSWLLKSTENYNIHTSVIIHENYGDGKAAGHVGSSILRRAESIISVNLERNNDNFSIVKCDRMRGKKFKQFDIGISDNDTPYVDIVMTEQKSPF